MIIPLLISLSLRKLISILKSFHKSFYINFERKKLTCPILKPNSCSPLKSVLNIKCGKTRFGFKKKEKGKTDDINNG